MASSESTLKGKKEKRKTSKQKKTRQEKAGCSPLISICSKRNYLGPIRLL